MAQQTQSSSYTHGHSNYTLATHQARTAESDAAFLLPYIEKTDHILDIGCGPGTITTGLAKYASEGTTTGVDISTEVLQKAKTLAAEANVPTQGQAPSSSKKKVLERLPYGNDTFDIVYSSQVFGICRHQTCHSGTDRDTTSAEASGILATRDASDSHFYPKSLGLDRLWLEMHVGLLLRARLTPIPRDENACVIACRRL